MRTGFAALMVSVLSVATQAQLTPHDMQFVQLLRDSQATAAQRDALLHERQRLGLAHEHTMQEHRQLQGQ